MLSEKVILQLSKRAKTDEELIAEIKEDIRRDAEILFERLKSQKEIITPSYRKESTHLNFYYQLGDYSRRLIYGKHQSIFGTVMISVILLAAVHTGIQTYEEFSQKNSFPLLVVDWFIFSFFAVEFILKIFAEKSKPYLYFVGKDGIWNSFDFIVLVFCLPGPYTSRLSRGNGGIIRLVTRLSRLMRVAKLLKRIPTLKVILTGMVTGLESISYILVVMFLFVYVFAVVGVIVFHKSDPFFFGSIPVAMMTLFHALTYDNWDFNIYINMYGCDNFNGGVYITRGNYSDDEWAAVPAMYRCDNPQKSPGFAIVYWIGFAIISSLILLNLFIGSITISMQMSLNEVTMEAEEAKRKQKLREQLKALENVRVREFEITMARRRPTMTQPPVIGFHHSVSTLFTSKKTTKKLTLDEEQELKRMSELRHMMQKAWYGTFPAEYRGEAFFIEGMSTREWMAREAALYARQILQHDFFEYAFVAFLVCTGLLVGFQVGTMDMQLSPEAAMVMTAAEWIVLVVFVLELMLQFAAEELNALRYFKKLSNIFDVGITVATAIPATGKIAPVIRLVRVLRIVKLVKAVPQLGVIVQALAMAFESISYIGIIILVTYYITAIVGLYLFQKNDVAVFSELHTAFLTLFDIATLDAWGHILYLNIYGCDKYPFGGTQPCIDPTSVNPIVSFIYFFVFIIFGSFVLLTLFIGVVTTAMDEAQKSFLNQQKIDMRLKEICTKMKITPRILDLYVRIFGMLDMDGNGSLEPTELLVGLRSVGIYPSPDELIEWIKEVDKDFNGVFDISEFIEFLINVHKKHRSTLMKKVIKKVIAGNKFAALKNLASKKGHMPDKLDSSTLSPSVVRGALSAVPRWSSRVFSFSSLSAKANPAAEFPVNSSQKLPVNSSQKMPVNSSQRSQSHKDNDSLPTAIPSKSLKKCKSVRFEFPEDPSPPQVSTSDYVPSPTSAWEEIEPTTDTQLQLQLQTQPQPQLGEAVAVSTVDGCDGLAPVEEVVSLFSVQSNSNSTVNRKVYSKSSRKAASTAQKSLAVEDYYDDEMPMPHRSSHPSESISSSKLLAQGHVDNPITLPHTTERNGSSIESGHGTIIPKELSKYESKPWLRPYKHATSAKQEQQLQQLQIQNHQQHHQQYQHLHQQPPLSEFASARLIGKSATYHSTRSVANIVKDSNPTSIVKDSNPSVASGPGLNMMVDGASPLGIKRYLQQSASVNSAYLSPAATASAAATVLISAPSTTLTHDIDVEVKYATKPWLRPYNSSQSPPSSSSSSTGGAVGRNVVDDINRLRQPENITPPSAFSPTSLPGSARSPASVSSYAEASIPTPKHHLQFSPSYSQWREALRGSDPLARPNLRYLMSPQGGAGNAIFYVPEEVHLDRSIPISATRDTFIGSLFASVDDNKGGNKDDGIESVASTVAGDEQKNRKTHSQVQFESALDAMKVSDSLDAHRTQTASFSTGTMPTKKPVHDNQNSSMPTVKPWLKPFSPQAQSMNISTNTQHFLTRNSRFLYHANSEKLSSTLHPLTHSDSDSTLHPLTHSLSDSTLHPLTHSVHDSVD